jgi:hypothetical protein
MLLNANHSKHLAHALVRLWWYDSPWWLYVYMNGSTLNTPKCIAICHVLLTLLCRCIHCVPGDCGTTHISSQTCSDDVLVEGREKIVVVHSCSFMWSCLRDAILPVTMEDLVRLSKDECTCLNYYSERDMKSLFDAGCRCWDAPTPCFDWTPHGSFLLFFTEVVLSRCAKAM